MLHKQSYASSVKRATVRFIHSSPEWAEVQKGKRLRLSPSLLDQARTIAGGASNDSIRRWLDTDISDDAEEERLSHRGRKPGHSVDFRMICLGHGIKRRLDLLPLSAEHIIEFARGCFNVELRQPYVSELLTSHGITSQLAMARNSRMTDPKVADDSVEFILELRRAANEFPGLLGMDETGLWSNVVERRTYHFSSQYVMTFFLPTRPNAQNRSLSPSISPSNYIRPQLRFQFLFIFFEITLL